jgi:ABC-type multidrug transport system fused ATPase/permease subunit
MSATPSSQEPELQEATTAQEATAAQEANAEREATAERESELGPGSPARGIDRSELDSRPPEIAAGSEAASARERLAALLGERKRTVVLLGICSTASGLAEAGILALIAQIGARTAHAQGRIGLVSVHESNKTLFVIAFALTIFRTIMQAPLSMLPARITSDVQASLRKQLFGAFTRASWSTQSSVREGHLQETLTSQVMQATNGAQQATSLVVSAFSFIVLMATAIYLNALAAIVILVAAVLLFAALRPLNALGARNAKALSRAQLHYAAGVSEASRLAEETQVFGVQGPWRERVGERIETAQHLFYRAVILARLAPALYQSAIYLILVVGLFALYESGSAKFAGLGAVILIIIRAGTYGQGVQGSYQGLRQSLPFISRLQNTSRRYNASTPVGGDAQLRNVSTVAFEHVTFGYRPERPVLKDISFGVGAGEAVGIIGPSGAGKSTIIQLLLQLRSPDSGRYLVNGIPVAEFKRSDWHERIAYVPQYPRLLHATVAENISYFRGVGIDEIERAGKLARIHDDIISWPKGYDTIVGPRVDAVSGGQQQRICLARALVARPEVLVLDEPTSALDPHSETLIQESLEGLRHELTLFIIAHRMSTLDICDRVMVIIDGRLVAFDTTELLGRTNDYYRNASLIAAGGGGGQLP